RKMRKFDLSLRSSRSSYFATFRHQLTILSKTDALDEEKWLNMLGTFVKDWFRYESHFVHGRDSLVDISSLVCRWSTILIAGASAPYLRINYVRSEERRVGKECRSGGWRYYEKEKDGAIKAIHPDGSVENLGSVGSGKPNDFADIPDGTQ